MTPFAISALILLSSGNYLGHLCHDLRENAPSIRHFQPGSREATLLNTYEEARVSGDMRTARDAAMRLAQMPAVPAEARAAFLAEQASIDRGTGFAKDSIVAVRTLKTWLAGNEKQQLLIDLDLALYMCQHKSKPGDWDVAFSERKAHMEYLFATYTPYHRDIIWMHIQFAKLFSDEFQGGSLNVSYLNLAQQHVDEACKIMSMVRTNPALAEDPSSIEADMNDLQEQADHWKVILTELMQRKNKESERSFDDDIGKSFDSAVNDESHPETAEPGPRPAGKGSETPKKDSGTSDAATLVTGELISGTDYGTYFRELISGTDYEIDSQRQSTKTPAAFAPD